MLGEAENDGEELRLDLLGLHLLADKVEARDGLVAHRGNLPLPAPRGRANPSKSTRTAATAPAGEGVGQDAYNKAMAEYSKTPFEYRHELGLYYHFILPNLIVGTQPQTREDIDRLKDVEGVTCMFDTQIGRAHV